MAVVRGKKQRLCRFYVAAGRSPQVAAIHGLLKNDFAWGESAVAVVNRWPLFPGGR